MSETIHTHIFAWNEAMLDIGADAIAICTKQNSIIENVRSTVIIGLDAVLAANPQLIKPILQRYPAKWWAGDIKIYISVKRHEIILFQDARKLIRSLGESKYSYGDVVAVSLLAIADPRHRLPKPSAAGT